MIWKEEELNIWVARLRRLPQIKKMDERTGLFSTFGLSSVLLPKR